MFAARHYFSPSVTLEYAINLAATDVVPYFFCICLFYLMDIQYMSLFRQLAVLLQESSLFLYAHIPSISWIMLFGNGLQSFLKIFPDQIANVRMAESCCVCDLLQTLSFAA